MILRRFQSNPIKQYLKILSVFLLISIINNSVIAHQAPEDGYYKREHSLVKPYTHGGGAMPFFESTGDTMVTNQFIRLTADEKSRRGGLWNKVPVYSRAWEAVITFKVHGSSRSLAADGFAFWYVNQKKQEGGTFGGPDQFKGLGIMLDTYKNGASTGAFPRVSGFINDGTWNFDHASDGDKQSFGHCYAMGRNRDHDTDIKIRYKEKRLSVHVDVDGSGQWRLCFERLNVILPTGYFFGFTAATGDLTDNHDIIALRTYQIQTTDKPADLEWAQETPRIDEVDPVRQEAVEQEEKKGSSVFMIIFVILLIIGAGFGYMFLQKKKERERKRFY